MNKLKNHIFHWKKNASVNVDKFISQQSKKTCKNTFVLSIFCDMHLRCIFGFDRVEANTID